MTSVWLYGCVEKDGLGRGLEILSPLEQCPLARVCAMGQPTPSAGDETAETMEYDSNELSFVRCQLADTV